MNPLPVTRAGLLLFVTGVHAGLLWAMQTMFQTPPVEAPKPHPVVMVQVLQAPQAQPEPPAPAVQPPAPKPPEPVPEPPKPKPKPVLKPTPKPKPPKPVARPAPKPEPAPEAVPEPAPAIAQRETVEPAAQPVPALPAAPPSQSAAVAAPAAPAASAPRFDAAYLNNPPPEYPAMARRRGEEGKVLLRVHVTAEGRAGDVRLHASSGSARLDEAAIAAVRNWRFVPARQGADTVAAWVQVPVNFRLN